MANPNSTYRVPVSSEITGLRSIPTDMNFFITSIYPNLKVLADAKVSKNRALASDAADDMLQEFIEYFFTGIDRNGNRRHTNYNPDYGLPYFKWVIQTFSLFISSRSTKQWEFGNRHVSLESSTSEDVEGYSFGVTEDTVSVNLSEVSMEEDLDLTLTMYSVTDKLSAYVKTQDGLFFEKCMDLWDLKLQGFNNSDISEKFLISPSAVAQWTKKLVGILDTVCGFTSSSLKAIED